MAVKSFEDSMNELETIVTQLEAGDITLDDSLKLFEEGIKLAKTCQGKLEEAEKKVKILVQSGNDEMTLEDFGEAE